MDICEHNRELMMRHLDGMLNLVEERTLEAHLRDCPACARDYELLRSADGLFRAVGAPEVAADEWSLMLNRMIHAADEERETISLAAQATEPPPVSRHEWSEVWSGVEREALLGKREHIEPVDIRPAVRKRSIWSEAAIGAAAAVLLLVGVFLILHGMLRPSPALPPNVADVIKVGEGYAYTTVVTDSEEPVYVIAMAGSIGSTSASTGSGYMHSPVDDRGVIEIAPRDFIVDDDDSGKPLEISPGDSGE